VGRKIIQIKKKKKLKQNTSQSITHIVLLFCGKDHWKYFIWNRL